MDGGLNGRLLCHESISRRAQGRILRFVSFVNWVVLTLAALATLIGAVVSLLMWPFPQVAAQGPRLSEVIFGTELSVGVAIVAGLATWLVDKRHPAFWLAEIVLVMALVVALGYGMAGR